MQHGHINIEKETRKNTHVVIAATKLPRVRKRSEKKMTGKTHRIGGIVAGVAFIKLSGQDNLDIVASVITGSVLGSLLPDIDHPKSTISRKLWFVSWPLVILRAAIRQTASTLPKSEEKKIDGIIGHRGITHSLLACISIGCAFLGLGFIMRDSLGTHYETYTSLILSLLLGMISHLFLDFFSNGIPLFCPVTNKRFGFKWIKTGSIAEYFVGILLTVLLVGLIGKESMIWIANRL